MKLDEQLISEEEGRAPDGYRDSQGYLSVGIGCCIDSRVKGAGLCDAAIDAQFDHDATNARAWAASFPGYDAMNDVQRAAITSMCYQLGTLHDWHELRAACAAHDWVAAAAAALDSAWARQTPARAQREAYMLKTGQWLDHGAQIPTETTNGT